MKFNPWSLIACIAFGLLALTGCKDAFERLDCRTICENYKECEESGLKVGDCTDDCFDAINGDAKLEDDARDCAQCIDDFRDRTCSEVSEDCDHCDTIYMAVMGGAAGM